MSSRDVCVCVLFVIVQSMSALSATKRDLAEFMTVVHRDTVHAVSGAATSISGMVNSSSTQVRGVWL